MRKSLVLPWAGLAVCLAMGSCQTDDRLTATRPSAATRPAIAGPGQLTASQWSRPCEHGLQTRLVPITRRARAGKPLFIRMEVRHKDGKGWAQAATVYDNDYPAEVVVRDNDGKIVDSLAVRLRFRTRVPAGAGISVGVFLAGKASSELRAGTYGVTIESRVMPVWMKRGAVQLPVAGPLRFEVPTETASARPDSMLQPDHEQAEELRIYMQARWWGHSVALLRQGKSIVPGLVALVETGDKMISDDYRVRVWQSAASMIGRIGDRRAVPFLLKRLNDKEAMSWRFVRCLGQLRVKPAVPRLIRELQTMADRGWQVTSSAYLSRATYLVKALEQITGQEFPRAEGRRWPDRDTTLKAINEWWAKQDPKVYALPETQPMPVASQDRG